MTVEPHGPINAILVTLFMVVVLGFVAYAFLTRYRRDWNDELRRWTRHPDDPDDAGR